MKIQKKYNDKNKILSIKSFIIILAIIISIISIAPKTQARLELDNINFDPAIIAAGDEVDIIVQFHAESINKDQDRIGNSDYKFKVTLLPDDTLTKEYVTIQDAQGDDMHGTLFSGDIYNKKFRIKVNNNAPSGNYEFKLEGRWYKNDIAEDGIQSLKFNMPVKKEGIILDITTIETIPSQVRPGDNSVEIKGYIENVGQKDSKSVEINLDLPKNIEASYTNNNRIWIGRVNAGENKETKFFIDINEEIEPGVYNINYSIEYMDLDDNKYTIKRSIPFLIKSKPYLEVIKTAGEGKAGDTSKLYVVIKNTGTQSAEAVDVRIIKQNSQPFTMDVRSDYIGELEPNEKGVAIFDIGINSDAEIKKHNFKILIRSKGDSDEGDDNIYTYNRRAEFKVTGKSTNYFGYIGVTGAFILLIIYMIRRKNRKNKSKKK